MTRRTLTVIFAASLVAVLIYNLWAYCCGRCAAVDFVQPGPLSLVLIGVSALAALALLILKVCRSRRGLRQRCCCGEITRLEWSFCPSCGSPLKPCRKAG